MIHNHLKKNENTVAIEYNGYTIYTTPDPSDKGQAALIYDNLTFITAVYIDKSFGDAIEKAKEKINTFSLKVASTLFNVTTDKIKAQYLKNAKDLQKMYDKAVSTGKKVNGYTASQLLEMKDRYFKLAEN